MSDETRHREPTPPRAGLPALFAVTALAYVLCDLLHELGHAAATLLPLGVKALSISTIGLSSSGSSAGVAAAGPLVNFVLSLALLLAAALVFLAAFGPGLRLAG